MKRAIRNSLILLSGLSSISYAASEVQVGGDSFLLTLFVGFFALIIVLQLIPALMLFAGLLKGLFVRNPKAEKHLN